MKDEERKGFLHERIYDDLLRAIHEKRYKLGDRLPSEKDLSQRYGVSRITSKKALDDLCENGYVARRPGKGTFLVANGETQRAAELPAPQAGRRPLVGLVMERVSSGFGSELLLGVERRLSALGYDLIVKFSHADPETERAAIEQLQAAGVSGLIIMCVYDELYNPLLLRLYTEAFPVVLIDRELQGLSIPFVGTDNRAAGKALADALFARGHTHIAFAVVKRSMTGSTIRQRMEGIAESFTERQRTIWGENAVLTVERDLVEDDVETSEENREHICRYMLEHPEVTGYVAASYFVTKQLEHAAAHLGRTVEIAGFDRPALPPTGKKPLCIVQNQARIGETAATHLDSLIQKKHVPPRVTYVDFRLV